MNDGDSEEAAKQIPAPPAKDAEFPEVAAKAPQHSPESKPSPHA
jgi:hypothetical protein